MLAPRASATQEESEATEIIASIIMKGIEPSFATRHVHHVVWIPDSLKERGDDKVLDPEMIDPEQPSPLAIRSRYIDL
jgi:hypothetical protein